MRKPFNNDAAATRSIPTPWKARNREIHRHALIRTALRGRCQHENTQGGASIAHTSCLSSSSSVVYSSLHNIGSHSDVTRRVFCPLTNAKVVICERKKQISHSSRDNPPFRMSASDSMFITFPNATQNTHLLLFDFTSTQFMFDTIRRRGPMCTEPVGGIAVALSFSGVSIWGTSGANSRHARI
eukprot:9504101-Pyramimonas_sp.AAC.1